MRLLAWLPFGTVPEHSQPLAGSRSQSRAPPVHAIPQAPLEQVASLCAPCGQLRVQLPQWSGSDEVSKQPSAQAVRAHVLAASWGGGGAPSSRASFTRISFNSFPEE